MQNEIEISIPKPPSLNSFYAGKHWSHRTKQKDEYFFKLDKIFEDVERFFASSYELHLVYNSKYDVDNCIIGAKFLSDYLRNRGYTTEDNPKYWRFLSIEFVESLGKNEFKAVIKYNE